MTHKRTHSNPKDDPEQTQINNLRSRFKKLHSCDEESDESFSSFLKDAKEHLVTKYLDDLQEFFKDLPENVNLMRRDTTWDHFARKEISVEGLARSFSIQGDTALQDRAVKLAFLRNFPEFYDQPEISIQKMIQAIETKHEPAARAILDACSKPASSLHVSGSVIKKGYDSPFLRSDLIIDPILETLNEYAKKWKKPDYFAPYAALIGPSMSGKSRLLMEMLRHVCVVYVCLRPLESTGNPPRSALADHMLSNDDNSESYYTSLLAGIFQAVANFFNDQDPAKERQARLEEWNAYTEVASSRPLDRAKRTQQRFTADVLKEMRNFDCRKGATLLEPVRAMSESTKFINRDLQVLLVLDEARALLKTPGPGNEISFFRTFRRAIGNIDPDKGFFAILVDTTSHVANFSFASKFDPSARYGFVGENRLFAPIYEIASFDAMVPFNPPQSWGELVSPERLFKYGNPIFGAYFRDAMAEQQKPRDIHRAILELAYYKLLGPTEHTQSGNVTKAQAFAFLGPTIQPRINGALHLNTELIASHAAHCDHISPGCDMVMCNYPSQFTFAAAAMMFLTDEHKLIQSIKALTTIVLHGLDAAGGAGELASRIILLLAMQATLTTSREGVVNAGPVRLVNFLKALTGKEEEDLDLGSIGPEQKYDLLNHGMIFWNHFSLIKYTPTLNELLQFLYRGMAAQCHPNQPGIDQIFTIYLKRDSDDLDEKNVSFCGIQAKNRQTDPKLEDENYKLTDIFSNVQIPKDNPYLMLYMNLNSTQDNVSTLPRLQRMKTRSTKDASGGKDIRRASLSFNGLRKFACLTEGVREALDELIHVEPDFIQLKPNEHGKLYSKIINPCLNRTA